MDPNLKFIIEKEKYNELPCLDVMLIKNLLSLTHERTVYWEVNTSHYFLIIHHLSNTRLLRSTF